jgi:hypothetical protein
MPVRSRFATSADTGWTLVKNRLKDQKQALSLDRYSPRFIEPHAPMLHTQQNHLDRSITCIGSPMFQDDD